MAQNNFSSIVMAAAVGGLAFWAAGEVGMAGDMAAALASVPTIITHFRWQQKGIVSLWLPAAAFLLCFLGLVLAQIAAARYTSSRIEASAFLLYPSLVMCFTISFSGPLLLLLGRKKTAAPRVQLQE